jgi:DNA repair protein RadB
MKDYRVASKLSVDSVIDELLEGGIESDIVTTVYGPAGSGKSCICMIIAVKIAKQGKKVIYVDTEGGFSVERIKQLDPEYQKTLQDIMVLRISNFQEQEEIFKKLNEMVTEKIGIIIIDSIAMLYRFEIGKNENIYGVNKSLGMQLSLLMDIARKKNVPSILANHVYADFDVPGEVKLVGGDILKYSSKCLVELKRHAGSIRSAIVRKNRSIPEKEIKFEIKNEGIRKI